MSTRERHTRARERASQFSNKNGSYEPAEAPPAKVEARRVLTVRKLLFFLLLLSGLGLGTGRAVFHPTGLMERILVDQSQCLEDYQGGAQLACVSLLELEKFKRLSPEETKEATLKVNISAANGTRIVYDSGFDKIALDEVINLSQILDRYTTELKKLRQNPDLTSFYASFAYHKYFKTPSPQGELRGEIYENFWGATFPDYIVKKFPGIRPVRISRFIRIMTYPDRLPTFPGDDFGFEMSYPETETGYIGMGPTGYTRAATWKQRRKAWELLSQAPTFIQELMLAEWAKTPPRS